jgi:hypothetical protein
MDAQADLLWRINNEYHKRLSQALTLVDLLEQMLRSCDNEHQPNVLAFLDHARAVVDSLVEELRVWRYHYYYESPETKRMVQTERAINQALARFNRLRAQQGPYLADLYTTLYDLPRPDPSLTHVPKGDLWIMTLYAIYDLLSFDDYSQTLEQAVR